MPTDDNTDGTDLSPPDDFGAAILAEFEKRVQSDEPNVATLDGDGPPGGWPSIETPATTTPATPPASGEGAEGAGGDASAAHTDADPPASTTTDPAADPAVTTDPASDPATTDTTTDAAADPAAGEPPSEPAGGWTWRWNDGTGEHESTFSDEQLQRAVALSAWADSLPDETRTAMGALETGQAVAIPRSDYDQFIAWKNQQAQASRDADLANLDVDPEVAKLIGGLRDEVQQLRGGTPAPDPRNDPQTQQTYAQLEAAAQRMEGAMANYAQSRGLAPDEVSDLMNAALRAEVIPGFMEAGSQFNPVTGALLRPADVAQVTEQALDWALIRNPALKTRVLSGQPPAAQPPASTPAPAAQPPANDTVAQKKARASSLATAPSGAPAPTPQTTRAMSETERVAAMAKEIEAALAAG